MPTTISRVYTVTVHYQGESHVFTKNFSHDGSLSQDEIYSIINNDFYSTMCLEVEPKYPFGFCTIHGAAMDEFGCPECHPTCCPKCSSHTFDGCPACEDYL